MRWIPMVVYVIVIAVLTVGCLVGCGIEGLHNANPTTRLRISPIRGTLDFSDNKDNDVTAQRIEYDPSSKRFLIDDLKITNNATKVREANSGQITAMAMQIGRILEGMERNVHAMGNLVAATLPIISNYPPPSAQRDQPGPVVPTPAKQEPTTQPVQD